MGRWSTWSLANAPVQFWRIAAIKKHLGIEKKIAA